MSGQAMGFEWAGRGPRAMGHPQYQDIEIDTNYIPEFHLDEIEPDETNCDIETNCDNPHQDEVASCDKIAPEGEGELKLKN